jgi:tripartite-type tricarboxylate transporter receptor subunit TctC
MVAQTPQGEIGMIGIVTTRRGALALGAAALAAPAAPARAQERFPARPVRLIVAFPPGGGTDLLGRLLAQRMQEALGQPVVVENRGGAGGNIAAVAVAQSPADGHAVLFTGSSLAVNEVLFRSPGYDSRRDFAPVARPANTPMMLVTHPALAARDVAGLIAEAKARPGALNCAVPGAGTAQHLAFELFNEMAGTSITGVPYRGGGPAIAAVVGGEVQMLISSAGSLEQLVRDGRVRALAVTMRQRLPGWPELPTVAETLPGYVAELWYGLYAPAATPAAVVAVLEAAVRDSVADPAFAQRLRERGFEPDFLGATALGPATQAERALWEPVIRRAGITPE